MEDEAGDEEEEEDEDVAAAPAVVVEHGADATDTNDAFDAMDGRIVCDCEAERVGEVVDPEEVLPRG